MIDERQKELALRIKILRAENDFTQEELAKRSGLSVCLIHNIETCKKKPRFNTLMKIAKAFEIDAEELLKYIC